MSDFPGRGYYRGNLDALVRDSIKAFDMLPPEKQAELRAAQKESWARGELGIGDDRQEQAEREKYRAKVSQSSSGGSEVRSEVSETPTPSASQTRQEARASGYTGDQCTNCNSLRMKVSGHCMVCEDCGTTTGCS